MDERVDVSEFINKVNIDVNECKFEIDTLQDILLQKYLRESVEFRQAFSTNYTQFYFNYLRDKAKLKEPVANCFIGNTRSGKSVGAISSLGYLQAWHGKAIAIRNISADEFEFLEQLKAVGKYDGFVVDEFKLAAFNIGSIAKRMKLQDVQNIIAVNCISTFMIRPDEWATGFANYGLKSFGRCFKTGVNRYLLYNLQESSKGGAMPLGLVYIPVFWKFLTYGKELKVEYDKKKQGWVDEEQHSERDVLFRSRIDEAVELSKDKVFGELKKKMERMVYASSQLGSEFTKAETEQIVTMASMLLKRIITEGQLRKEA